MKNVNAKADYSPMIPPEVIADIQSFRDKLIRLPQDYRLYLNGVAAGLLMAERIDASNAMQTSAVQR